MGRNRRAWMPNGTGRRTDGRPGYYVFWKDRSTGRVQLKSRRFETAVAARRYMRMRNAQQDLGLIGEAVPQPLLDATQEFLKALGARSAETIRQYDVTLRLLHQSIGADPPVCEIERRAIDRFIAGRMESASEATAAKHVRHLRRFLNWCVKAGYLLTSPLESAGSLPRNDRVRTKPYVTDADFRRLLEACDTEDRRLAVKIAGTTALDRGVIASLRAEDVDLQGLQFRCIRAKVKRPVSPFVHDALIPALSQRMRCAQPGRPLLIGVDRDRSGDWFRDAARKAGLPTLTFRDLRTFAVNWIRGILGDFAAQRIAGHSTPLVTSRHYYQMDPAAQALVSARPLPGSPAVGAAPQTAAAGTASPAA